MEIKLLGTGSAEGWPGLFCRCDICRRSRELGGKHLRTRTSALIDGVVKIDLPPDTLQHIHTQGLDMTKVEFLIFTHAHDDHLAAAVARHPKRFAGFATLPMASPDACAAELARTV